MTSNSLIFLFGPTGVGKTALLQQHFQSGYQVINADSKQIYRHASIGSAKPEQAILDTITHHLIDIAEPSEIFSVGQFVHLADEAVKKIHDEGDIPLLCGGTAYYFKHFYYGVPLTPKSDEASRLFASSLVKERGLSWCYTYIQEIDPLSAQKIHPHDRYRITRVLEVYHATGLPLSDFALPTTSRLKTLPLIIGLKRDKKELDQRISNRVHAMFNEGLKQEFEQLLKMGAKRHWPAMEGIGYQEFFTQIDDPSISDEEVAEMIITHSRRYAKRQMTFFRSLDHVNWVHPDDDESITRLIGDYLQR
ncbi:MAG: tRNA (adenosine(37)-N6)-dimethylallyltransferase MiaA [Sphaerochaetaceae bacterium]|jgi:tRNA dimethylallyltransferase